VQNTKDTFYETLRNRLAALNPDRTIVIRGVTRPGTLVEENELVTAVDVPDCFRLRWRPAAIDAKGTLPLATLQCEIAYETAGTALNSGMDRGRALAAMDGELLAALNQAPQNAVKTNYAGLAFGHAAITMNTSLWWASVAFGPTEIKDDRLARIATVDVMSFEETGEL